MKRLLLTALLTVVLFVAAVPRALAGDGVMFPGYTPPPPPLSAAQVATVQFVVTTVSMRLP